MSRPKEFRKIVDTSHPSMPLQTNPFALLGELDKLKNLPSVPQSQAEPPGRSRAKSGSPEPQLRKSRGRLVLRRETKDRGGKIVVVISGFTELPGANAVMIADLARQLKGKLGCGGSFDRQEIILQGDRCAEVCAELEEMGFRVGGVTLGA